MSTVNKFDLAAEIAFFLLEETGSIFGRWQGRMTAAEQKDLFGRSLKKTWIVIDGNAGTVSAFGSDKTFPFASFKI